MASGASRAAAPSRAGPACGGAIEPERTGGYGVWIENGTDRVASAEFEVVLPTSSAIRPAPEVLAELSALCARPCGRPGAPDGAVGRVARRRGPFRADFGAARRRLGPLADAARRTGRTRARVDPAQAFRTNVDRHPHDAKPLAHLAATLLALALRARRRRSPQRDGGWPWVCDSADTREARALAETALSRQQSERNVGARLSRHWERSRAAPRRSAAAAERRGAGMARRSTELGAGVGAATWASERLAELPEAARALYATRSEPRRSEALELARAARATRAPCRGRAALSANAVGK